MERFNLSKEELIENLSDANRHIEVLEQYYKETHESMMELATKLSEIWQIWDGEPEQREMLDKLDKIMDEDVIPLLLKAGLNEYGE